MAIKIAADLRRLTRAGVWSLAGILTFCGAAMGQAPLVSWGSVVPIPYNDSMNQIYKILFYKGNVLALDSGADVLYQLAPGATAWSNISGTARNSGFLGGGYNAASMAIDAVGNLYVTANSAPSTAPTALFWRFPYDAAKNTWDLSTAYAWGGNIIDPNNQPTPIVAESGQGTQDVQFENSAAMDGSGTLYFVTAANQIDSIPILDSKGDLGNNGVATSIVNYLNGGGTHMAIDAAGNIYFVEGHAINCTGTPCVRPAGTTGIWFVPAGTTGITGKNGSAEQTLQNNGWRIDNMQESSTSPVVYAGVTLDAAGNLYMTSEVNGGYAETFAGVWEIPNVCGAAPSASNVNTCMDDSDIALLAPISSNQPLAIDSRGYFWIPTYQTYGPPGEGTEPNVYSIVVFAPGVLNLNYPLLGTSGAQTGSAVGAAAPAGNLYVSFNGTFQPSGFQFSSATGSASDFSLTLTNPLPNTASTTPTVPCNSTAGNANNAYNTYSTTNSCLLWVTMDPTVPGPISGELTMYGTETTSAGAKVPYSVTAYVNGTGLGSGVGMLDSPTLSTLSAFAPTDTPGQVATDINGNVWVADPSAKQVLYFPAGSSNAAGKSVGSGLSDPTGVAVDATGDVYIADWNSSKKLGSVYEIPWVPNTKAPAYGAPGTQIALSTKAMGLGNNLNLAVDGSGNVYVADPQHARVVKIPTPAQASLAVNPETAGDTSATTTVTVGSGFTAPSAVAVDAFGDVFVGDGTSLYEITGFPLDAQTDITDALPAPVTGLAVDASGSVIAALSGAGLYRIPYTVSQGVGTFDINSASLIDTTVNLAGSSAIQPSCNCPDNSFNTYAANIQNPGGVALDQEGNIYVTDIDPAAGPNLYELNVVNGLVDYGVGLTTNVADEQDLDLYNIGNEPLNLKGNSYSFAGPDIADYSLIAPSAGTECDTTGATSVASGTSCALGPAFTPPALPPTDLTPTLYAGDTLSIPTNANNIGGGGTAVAALQAASVNNLETTATQVQVNVTQATYPGSATVTVNIGEAAGSQYSYPANAPTGTVVLILSCASKGCTQASIVETGTVQLSSCSGQNCSVTFSNLPPLDGGNYNVTANYQGSVLQLMGKSSGNAQFTINTATPVITLSEPVGVSPNAVNGVYYLQDGTPNTLVANVSSKVGIPTGTVTLTDAKQGSLGAASYTSSQNWSFSTNSLAVASYSVIATYHGDQNYSAVSTTVPVTFQIIPPSVLLTASPASVTTKAGTPVTSTITLNSLVGFSAPSGANITCAFTQANTPPYYSECTFDNPQPIICAPSATNNTCQPTTTVLTLNTNIPVNLPANASNTQRPQPFRSPFELAGILGLGLLGLAVRRRAIFNRYLMNLVCLVLFCAGAVMGITSCTNAGYTHTPPAPVYTTASGTYNITIQVTNTATGQVESLPFTLGVNVQ